MANPRCRMRAVKMRPEHEAAVEGLIPDAVAFANREILETNVRRDERSGEWSRLFHGEMDRMAVAAGLRTPLA